MRPMVILKLARRFPRGISARRREIVIRDAQRNARARQYRSMVDLYLKHEGIWTKQ